MSCHSVPTAALSRTFDVERLNALANHPDIRPTCGGDGKSFIDLGPFLADELNHAVAWETGCFLLGWSAPHTYEVHLMVLPEGRGREAYDHAGGMIAYMQAHGAERLWARVAKAARGLRHYTWHAGFRPCGEHTLNLGFGPVSYDLYQWTSPCLQQ
jgi:hypothetical protein